MISGLSCISKFSILFANLICRQEAALKLTKSVSIIVSSLEVCRKDCVMPDYSRREELQALRQPVGGHLSQLPEQARTVRGLQATTFCQWPEASNFLHNEKIEQIKIDLIGYCNICICESGKHEKRGLVVAGNLRKICNKYFYESTSLSFFKKFKENLID